MAKFDDSLNRMKGLMDYGKLNESKQYSDKSLEHSTEGADGKIYGIVREGKDFFIKIADKPSNGKRMIAEDFDYIGGWMNRRNNQYASYSNTLKNFDLKMMGLAEAYNKVGEVVTESIDPSQKENVLVEATEGMRYEINRLKSIMRNAELISEGKCLTESKNEFCPVVGGKAECGCDTAKAGKNSKQKAISAEGGEIAKKEPKAKKSKLGEGKYINVKGKWYDKKGHMVNESEVLAWSEDENYLDTQHGTEIGDGAPFDKKAKTDGAPIKKDENSESEGETTEDKTVNEGMEEPTKFSGYHQIDKGLPSKGGMGEVGDGAPFDEPIKECGNSIDECDVNEDFDIDDILDDENPDTNAEEAPDSDSIATELDLADDDNDGDDTIEINGTDDDDVEEDAMSMLRDIKDRLSKLEDRFDNDEDAEFDDDNLYDDDDDNEGDDGVEGDDEGVQYDDDYPDTEDENKHDNGMSESRVVKKGKGQKLSEDKLNYFGKHPAYQKKVMTLPTNKHAEKEGYDDWNDENVKGDAPFGQKIGDSAPFDIDPERMDNAIAESIKKVMQKSKKKH